MKKPQQSERTGHTGRFDNSRHRVDAVLVVVTCLQVIAVYVMKSDAAPILATTLPSMLGLVYGWTHVTNKAETDVPVLPKPEQE